MNDTIGAEVARYATAVRAAFADLPRPDRELLLEDLEDHLQEVAAEAGGPLSERLGRPEAYAAELRASAGLPATVPGAHGRRRGLRESAVAHRLERLWRGARAHPAGGAVVDFLPELRPAWWVLRGYLAVQAVAIATSLLFQGAGLSFPVPALFGSRVLGLLATVAAVVASVALGRRRDAASHRVRALTLAGNAALALFAVFVLLELGSSEANDDYRPEYVTSYSGPLDGLRSDGKEISNIFPFDADGKPLRDVYLIDQDGDPVAANNYDNPQLETERPLDRDGGEVVNRYPQVEHEVDPVTGQRSPGPTPEFQPPPGPVRSP
ncbi:MAG TPA: hypothetical protein VFS70_05385 [Actinomycetota bacterium]|nr:hypothetical protein [Actinomycetota bacterium]